MSTLVYISRKMKIARLSTLLFWGLMGIAGIALYFQVFLPYPALILLFGTNVLLLRRFLQFRIESKKLLIVCAVVIACSLWILFTTGIKWSWATTILGIINFWARMFSIMPEE